MKVRRFHFQSKPVLYAGEFLNRADTTAAQTRCNNAQVSADRAIKFPHAESFARRPSNSLNEIKRNRGVESGSFIQSQGKAQKWGTRLPLLEVRTICPSGGPRQSLVGDFQWLAFTCPMKGTRHELPRPQHPANLVMRTVCDFRQKKEDLDMTLKIMNPTNGITKIAKFWGRQGTRGDVKGQKGT